MLRNGEPAMWCVVPQLRLAELLQQAWPDQWDYFQFVNSVDEIPDDYPVPPMAQINLEGWPTYGHKHPEPRARHRRRVEGSACIGMSWPS